MYVYNISIRHNSFAVACLTSMQAVYYCRSLAARRQLLSLKSAWHAVPASVSGWIRWDSSLKADSKVKKGGKDNNYSHTLNLPTTSFNQRANSHIREPELQKVFLTVLFVASVDSEEVLVIVVGGPQDL